jgi:hypothetical protein
MTAKALKESSAATTAAIESKEEAPAPAHHESLVGVCLAARHPTLEGRVKVRWLDHRGDLHERWMPTLRSIVVREQDRVLMLWASNEPEPIVVGVVDGFSRRAEPPRHPAVALELKGDETFRVTTDRGQPLLEVVQGAEGPVVRILNSDTALELPGKLKITAAEIELKADRGGVRIEANDDVDIKGEMIRLN